MPTSKLAFWILPAIFLSAPVSVRADETGSVTGVVTTDNGRPIEFATLRIVNGGAETVAGALSDSQGRFTISRVPLGTYVLKASFIGFVVAERPITISPSVPVVVQFALKETIVNEYKVIVVADPLAPDRVKDSGTKYRDPKSKMDDVPVEGFEEYIGTHPGMVIQAGEIHPRAGRAGELQYQMDGIPVNDPLDQGPARVATISISESEIILGGMDAEYGNAQSGVVNIITQEGGDLFAGEATYMTDDFGAPDKTYDNYDRVTVGMGGPTPFRNLTYYISGEGTWTDTYLATREVRERHQILDFISIGPRQSNEINYQAKLAWRPQSTFKLTLELLRNIRRYDNYEHPWSRVGYVETQTDTVEDSGEIVTRYGRFSEEQEGPNWIYFNGPEHTPNYSDESSIYKAVWTQTLTKGTFYTLKLSRSRHGFLSSVRNVLPWEYMGQYPDQWRDRINFQLSPYYATNGDVPTYSERTTDVWTLKTDWTSQLGMHKFKTGLEYRYNDLQNFQVNYPERLNGNGQYGLFRSQFHYYNSEGSFYAQDRWEHEGMVVNAGIRYDVFSVGNQISASEVENRLRSQWSPRVGIAFPITVRTGLSFHYGRFSQVPDRRAIFEDRGAAVATRGNPNLENETTVSYQAALQHNFSDDVSGQFSLYFKDIFGLLSADQVRSGDSPNLVTQWTNRDYASARGFEVSINKRFNRTFSADLAYTYGVATGVASDPNIQQQLNFLYLPISEQPLDWDQRHTISATTTVAKPNDWQVNMIWTLGTGFPYTPWNRDQRQADPALTNSRRLPSSSSLSIQAEKHYKIWGQQIELFLRGNNVLNAQTIVNLSPTDFPPPPQFNNLNYQIYYTETGKAGGAYLGDDTNEDGVQDWVPLHDPRVFGEGRSVRLGATVKF
jgi:outer membrane receptor for ferrienterochelin and colicin